MEDRLFPIGRVIKPHGVKGKIKIEYFGEDPARFSLYKEIFIENPEGRLRSYKVLEVIPKPPGFLLQLKGIERREEVESLKGKEILIRRRTLPVLNEGEYYWIDLLGMRVETLEGKMIGELKAIFPTKANDVYVVKGRRKEIFLPATEEVIQSIDLEKKVMKVFRMERLWEEEDEV
jgi:16S rRNA processing protein RimM